MSKRSKHKGTSPNIPPKPVSITEGMQRIKQLADATNKGYEQGLQDGFEQGRAEATKFASYAMCAAVALALHELHGFGSMRACRVLNLAGRKMFDAFTSRELIEEAYKEMGFAFEENPMTGDLVEEVE